MMAPNSPSGSTNMSGAQQAAAMNSKSVNQEAKAVMLGGESNLKAAVKALKFFPPRAKPKSTNLSTAKQGIKRKAFNGGPMGGAGGGGGGAGVMGSIMLSKNGQALYPRNTYSSGQLNANGPHTKYSTMPVYSKKQREEEMAKARAYAEYDLAIKEAKAEEEAKKRREIAELYAASKAEDNNNPEERPGFLGRFGL